MSAWVTLACLAAIVVLVAGIIKTWCDVIRRKPWDGQR